MKMSEFTPLGQRVEKNEYETKNRFAWFISIIVPFIVYSFLSVAFTLIIAYMVRNIPILSGVLENDALPLAIIIRVLSVGLAVLPLLFSFYLEQPILVHKKHSATYYLIVVLAAGSLALGLNSLATVSGFAAGSQSFSDTASNQFSLPIWAGIIVYGMVTPVTEEVVYRGLIYNRLRKQLNVILSLIFSSLLFGLSHGNYVQLVYGFCMGCVICLIYEKFGAFLYPVIFHCVANTVVYVCMSVVAIKLHIFSVFGAAIELLIAGACIIAIVGLNPGEKY